MSVDFVVRSAALNCGHRRLVDADAKSCRTIGCSSQAASGKFLVEASTDSTQCLTNQCKKKREKHMNIYC
eukprot:683966-Amphidinium_carterae.1